MLKLLPLKQKISKVLKKYSLEKKFQKQLSFLLKDPKHPSLHLELLEPKQYGVYSFRINRKFRSLFIFRPEHKAIEIIAVTLHYQ